MTKHRFSSAVLALCALAFFSSPAFGQTVVNPSFETDASTGAATGPITGWPFTAGSGGINDSAGPFANNGTIPDGTKVAFIHFAGTMHQVVSGFNPGQQYRLRYYENARLGAGTTNLQVSVGGVPVVATHQVVAVGGSIPYVQKTTAAFTATAASLDVAFVVTGTGDFTVLLDKVEIFKNLDVTNLADTGPGSLRQAILDAPAGSTITFAPGVTGTVGMLAGKIVIDKNLTIVGPGSSKFILSNARGEGVDTGLGVDNRIFEVNGGVTAAISGLTVTGGRTFEVQDAGSGGGGINSNGVLTLTDVTVSDCRAECSVVFPNYGTCNNFGGGIVSSSGVLTLNNCTIVNNQARNGGGVAGSFTINNSLIEGNLSGKGLGGGLYGNGTINNSTISGNTALGFRSYEGGGGIAAMGLVTLTNTTVSGNTALYGAENNLTSRPQGGGIYAWDEVILINSTVTNNTLTTGPDVSDNTPGAGGISMEFDGNVTMRNSILAGNTVDIYPLFGGSVISQGYNLIGSLGSVPITGSTTGNIVGTNAAPANAKLAPLGFYGGLTPTHALLTTSPAINAGNTANSPATDQRGAARVGTADIGAFEVNNTANGGTYLMMLPQGALNVPYSYTLVRNSGGYTYTVTSGALPAGITVSTQANVVTLSGTPTAAGTFNFAITASNGTITNATNYRLSVSAIAPSVTAINPSSGTVIGSETVTITGTNFTGATGVSIGGTPVISFSVLSATSITAVTPAHVQGTASVVVSTPVSVTAANTLYTYLPAIFTQPQYTANYTAGQNNVINSPNTFNLYTLSQVQSLNVGVPLLVKDTATGKFKLTIAVRKSPNLMTTPFTLFPMNGAGMTSTINAQGTLDFVFPAPGNAAFFRLESSP